MRILGIETSCDETAVSIIEAEGDEKAASFKILGNALVSQIEVHREYGGVFPALAKREHAKNLVPLLEAALEEAELLHEDAQTISDDVRTQISNILEREPGLGEAFFEFVTECEPPEIDAIAVTAGPGLEPALWVGINFAKALALLWNKPLISVDHMEGHLLSSLLKEGAIRDTKLPILGLLISGGHTELLLMKDWLSYELIGQTRDDAVGEAFDKVARMLGLPYPGGPEISKLAEEARKDSSKNPFTFPRPMLDSDTLDFSFAGLKTAVLYALKKLPALTEEDKKHVALAFEDAATDVLWKKTSRALEATGAATLTIGGGVSANAHIRRTFEEKIKAEHPHVALRIPSRELTTDNAVMIALAGFYRALKNEYAERDSIVAEGNRRLA